MKLKLLIARRWIVLGGCALLFPLAFWMWHLFKQEKDVSLAQGGSVALFLYLSVYIAAYSHLITPIRWFFGLTALSAVMLFVCTATYLLVGDAIAATHAKIVQEAKEHIEMTERKTC